MIHKSIGNFKITRPNKKGLTKHKIKLHRIYSKLIWKNTTHIALVFIILVRIETFASLDVAELV
jgi:hypothetical protein